MLFSTLHHVISFQQPIVLEFELQPLLLLWAKSQVIQLFIINNKNSSTLTFAIFASYCCDSFAVICWSFSFQNSSTAWRWFEWVTPRQTRNAWSKRVLLKKFFTIKEKKEANLSLISLPCLSFLRRTFSFLEYESHLERTKCAVCWSLYSVKNWKTKVKTFLFQPSTFFVLQMLLIMQESPSLFSFLLILMLQV